ncbi:hypothetical protein J4573_37590 [Actinomadura barringtoniae]|uniref:Secreted protein n=1 Tax=Actinomadura barringtoniae TaxID=1427535 RepID=A0A939T4R1_9ACTN|nr:hypothetical protein [Actinomadura barringtoniae]MBO2452856.1 hypothetical protein [Actinomadura barringtoniae]
MHKTWKLALTAIAAGSAATALAAPASAAPAKLKSCDGTVVAPPFKSDWTVGQGSAGIAGSPGWKQGYDINLQSNVGIAVAEVKGYNDQNKETWYGVPAMSPDSPHRIIAVPWGNNLAMPAVRIKAAPGQITGVTVTFNC